MVGTSDSVHALASSRSGIWAQLQEESSSLRPLDILVFALILGIGALQFFYSARSPDFLGEDVFWADSARSLVDHGYYGINGYAETNMPPGLPVILALLRIAGAVAHCHPVVEDFRGRIDAHTVIRESIAAYRRFRPHHDVPVVSHSPLLLPCRGRGVMPECAALERSQM